METFKYTRAESASQAVQLTGQSPTAQQGAQVRFVAGGTTLLDLMKLHVERPATEVDINRLPLDKVEKLPHGGLKIGALVRNSDLAHDPTVQSDYAVLSQALLSGASAQSRNMATTGGNLLQRTRCVYFRNRRLRATSASRGNCGLRAELRRGPQAAGGTAAGQPVPAFWRRSRGDPRTRPK